MFQSESPLFSRLRAAPSPSVAERMCLNQRRNSPFIEYLKDKLSIRYVGRGLAYPDVAAVQANLRVDPDALVFYFEVRVNTTATRSRITVGFADADFPLNKHPGCTRRSYAYRGDGRAVHAKKPTEKLLPRFEPECVVGAGINFIRDEIFLTFNGEYHGAAFSHLEKCDFFPTAGVDSVPDNITFNFGKRPFRFNLDKFVADEKQRTLAEIAEVPLHPFDLHKLVHSYLYFGGYRATIAALERATGMEEADVQFPQGAGGPERLEANGNGAHAKPLERTRSELDSKMVAEASREFPFRKSSEQMHDEAKPLSPQHRKASVFSDFNENVLPTANHSNGRNGFSNHGPTKLMLAERSALRSLILDANWSEARTYAQKAFPEAWAREREVGFIFDVHDFIELVRAGAQDAAGQFVHARLHQYIDARFAFRSFDAGENGLEYQLEDVLALMCYKRPEKSPLSHLLTQAQLECSFDRINSLILGPHASERSAFDFLFGQLHALSDHSKEHGFVLGDQLRGENFL